MIDILEGAGLFIWPLALCSFLALFIIVERLLALRESNVIPASIRDDFIRGHIPADPDPASVAGRILYFYQMQNPDAEQLKAFARLQAVRMERGLFVLEVVTAAAPLLGLLGTVTGLMKVFAEISPDTGLPDQAAFVEGVAQALSTTMIGLAIAIPALVFNGYLNRRIDTLSAQLSVGVERLVSLSSANPAKKA